MKKKEEYPGYVLCYTMRIPKTDPAPFTTPYVDYSHWNIYTEVTKEGATPIIQAKYQLKQLLKNPNLHNWSLAKIISTGGEHHKMIKQIKIKAL